MSMNTAGLAGSDFPGLPDPARQYQNQFSYENWPPHTTINMYNVPYDAMYRDIIHWLPGQKEAYFNSLPTVQIALGNASIVKPGMPIRINVPFAKANHYNYMVVKSPPNVPGDDSQTYYYFINEMTYLAGNTTALSVQLDVWSTYHDRITLGRAYVVRGHIGISNANARIVSEGIVTPHYANLYLTNPEGLDIGSDYYSDPGVFVNFAGDAPPVVMIQSTAKLTGDLGSIADPSLATAIGGITTNVPNGCEVYYVKGSDLTALLQYLSTYAWVSSCIISMHLLPASLVQTLGTVNIGPVTVQSPRVSATRAPITRTESLGDLVGIREFNEAYPRAKNLLKFHVYPYCVVEITANTGSSVTFKPEHLSDGIRGWYNEVVEIFLQSIMVPPSPRVRIGVRGYLAEGRVRGSTTSFLVDGSNTITRNIPTGEEYANSLVLGDFPTFGVANNSAVVAMASSANSRAWENDTAQWTQTKTMASSATSYDQSSASMNTQSANLTASIEGSNRATSIQNNATQFQGNMALINGAAGTLGSAATGNAGGAVQGLVSMGTAAASTNNAISTATQQNANATGVQHTIGANNIGLAGNVRDSNLSLANFAAKGDYQNAIAGINARTQDLRLTPPSIVGGFGGDALNISTGVWGYSIRHKRISPQAIAILTDVWNRYGYYVQVNMGIQSRLMNMTNFTYWQVQDCSVLSTALPETHKQTIRGIFEKGVTLWRTPELIGRIDLEDNEIVEGMAYYG